MSKKRKRPTCKFKVRNVVCPYCKKLATITNGRRIYTHAPAASYLRKLYYWCQPCDAYCGVHAGTNLPLGTLANKKLRKLRQEAHAYLDPLWQKQGLTRNEVYHKLAKILGIPRDQCHIAMFDEDMCERAIKACLEIGDQINGNSL